MTVYTNVFGNMTLPPAEYGYRSLAMTGDVTLVWPYNSDSAELTVSKIMDITCQAGDAIILPDATQVSTGEDFLVRNLGSNALVVKNASGGTVGNVAAGVAVYFYLTDNTTTNGVYHSLVYGAGSSAVDAASLVGYGIKAIGASLNQSHPITTISGPSTIDHTQRAQTVVSTGGAITISLASAISLGNDFFFLFRNNGTGTATIDPYSSELIDGQMSMTIQPGESLLIFCSGTTWYTVGYGRSTIYQFTQLVKDVSAGGTFTLTASEASNKLLTFIGNPVAGVTVVVPSVVSVYYCYSQLSTAQTVTVKTSGGTGVAVPQGARIIAICDGTNVISAQSVQSNTTVSLVDGSSVLPSLTFSSQTNTGVYKAGANGFGITVNGTPRLEFSSTLATFADTTNLKLPVLLNDGTTTTKVGFALA